MTVYSPTAVELADITIPADGESIEAADVNVPLSAIADGVVFCRAGRLLAVTVLTAASGTHTTSAATASMRIRGLGGGGSGGGCPSTADANVGGGGAAGSYAEKFFACDPSTGYAWTRGAGGPGVSASGTAGGNSTFDANGTTVTAKGGASGTPGVNSAAVQCQLGGVGVISTNGDVNGIGESGDAGMITLVAGPVGIGGKGGSTFLGSGGRSIIAAGAGTAATGYGAGGGGALTGVTTARAGGSGTDGIWIVEEYS